MLRVKATFPDWVVPMAATLTQERFTGPEWIFERKLDGIRVLAFKHGTDVRLLSRNKLPLNDAYPSVVDSLKALPVRDIILDGEATGAWGRQGRFTYHVFDVLWLDGRDVTSLTLEERQALLKKVHFRSPVGRVEALDDDKPWERACAEGWEGVIAKRRDSKYRAPALASLAEDEVRGEPGTGRRRLHGSTGPACRSRCFARRLLRRRRPGVRGQGRHGVGHQGCCSTCEGV